jgi:hypothetical protein
LVVVCLSFILIGNIVALNSNKPAKIPLLFLIDVSPSMGEKLDQAQKVIADFKQSTKYKTQYFSFADSLLGGTKSESLRVLGTKTDIAKALTMAKKKDPGAVILLSDGQHNTLSDPIRIASELPFPVYTIGLGKTAQHDVAIGRVSTPKRVFLGETATVVVRITSQGLGNKKSKVSIIQGTQELQKQEIILTEIKTEQEVSFHLVPTEIGKIIYKVKVSSFEEEDNLLNNEKEFGINILKSKLKVIVLSNSPNFNIRFIISGLKTEQIDALPVLAFQDGRFQRTTDLGMKDFVFKLNCDVLILDNFNAARLSADINNQIHSFVQDGGGLLYLWGEESQLSQTLSDLLPFVHSSRVIRKEIFPKLTEQGITVPVFYDSGENLLDNTPPMLGIAEVKESRKEAQVWAMADPVATPLIGYWKFGKGKVIEITGFPIWRLGFYGSDLEIAQQKFRKLLVQVCRFLALKDFEMFSLQSDQPIYRSGENVNFTFQAYKEDGRPWSGLDVNLIISEKQTPIPMIEISSGIYEATVEALPANDYTVRAIAKLDTRRVGEAKTEFHVSETNIELAETGVNSDLLRRIAEVSGGEYFDAESFSVTGLDFTFARYHNTFRFDPRRSPYLYIILAGFFLIELYIRKRRGLM